MCRKYEIHFLKKLIKRFGCFFLSVLAENVVSLRTKITLFSLDPDNRTERDLDILAAKREEKDFVE